MAYRIIANLQQTKWACSIGADFFSSKSHARLALGAPLDESDLTAWSNVTVTLSTSQKATPPLNDFIGGNPFYLSQRAVDLFKLYSNEAHCFIPVKAIFEVTGLDAGLRYALYVPAGVNFIDYEQTLFARGSQLSEPSRGIEAGRSSGFRTAPMNRIIIKASAIRGLHLWRNVEMQDGGLYISDELFRAMQTAGITGVTFE